MKSSQTATCRVGFFVTLSFVPRLCAASSPRPVFSSDPETIDSCIDWFNNGDSTSSCEYVRGLFGISPEEFHEWNPSVSVDCEPWHYPFSYCVSTSDRPPPPGIITTSADAYFLTTSATSSSPLPSPTSWRARGCYPDDDPDYPVPETMISDEAGDPSLDIASCENSCWEASVNRTVLYAGVKHGNQCWCSSFIGGESTRDQEKCDMPCSGDEDEVCGGKDHINVFEPVTTTISSSDPESKTETASATSNAQSTTDSGAV